MRPVFSKTLRTGRLCPAGQSAFSPGEEDRDTTGTGSGIMMRSSSKEKGPTKGHQDHIEVKGGQYLSMEPVTGVRGRKLFVLQKKKYDF